MKKYIHKIFLYTCVIMFLFTLSLRAAHPPDIILVIIDQCSLATLENTPTKTIDNLQQIGAFGLMNVRTAGNLKPESTYLTAGNGKKCKGSNYTHFGEYNGKNIINRHIEEIIRINQSTNFTPYIGLLGKTCRENNKKIAVFGNTDTKEQKRRIAVSLAMDEYGNVNNGDVSQNILKKTNLPWGFRADWNVMKIKLKNSLSDNDLIIIDTGDTARIADYHSQLTEYEILKRKREAIKNIDDFLSYLVQNVNLEKTVLGIVSFTPSPIEIKKGNKLTWILWAGKGIEQGWLTSRTTRRKGIITITDFLPSVVSALSVNKNYLQTYKITGYPVETIKEDVCWNELLKLNRHITNMSELRTPFIQLFIALQLFVIIMAIICIFYKKLYSSIIIQYLIEYLLLVLFLIPINFLFISLFDFPGILYYLLFLLLFSILEIYIIRKICTGCIEKLILISLILILIIAVDLFNNNFLIADSLLGYSSIIGARFYGLGNEYMGLLIGATVICITGFIELNSGEKNSKYIRGIALLSFCIIVFLIGAPHLGANFGGTITAIVTFCISWLYLRGYSLNIKTILATIIILILIIGGIIYLDYMQLLTPRTHIGNAVKPIIKGDFLEIKNIISRKIQMNIKLMKWTIWTRAIIAFLIYIVILFQHPVGQLKKIFKRYPHLAAGFYGGLTGSIITLIVNDSGVVATATLLFYPMLGLLYIFNELNRRENQFINC